MAKAELTALESLHELMATVMKEQLDASRTSEDGPAPAMLSVIRQFLKDNHVEANGAQSDTSEMAKALEAMNDLPYDGEARTQ